MRSNIPVERDRQQAALVAELNAILRVGLEHDAATTILHSLHADVLAPNGMFLNGGLHHFGSESPLPPRIEGLLTRSDETNIKEGDISEVRRWLAMNPSIVEVAIGELKPSDSPGFMPLGSEDSNV